MSRSIRISIGDVTAYDLLNDADSLVIDWPLQTGMTKQTAWRASQPEGAEMRRQGKPSLAKGSGKWVSLWSGIIELWAFNGAMREYINETILENKPTNLVTAYLHSAEHDSFQVFTGELVTPHALESEGEYSRFSDDLYYGNRYIFRRAVRKTIVVLAATSGKAILTTANKALAVEQQV